MTRFAWAKSPTFKRSLHLMGSVIAVASLYFVGRRLYQYRHDIDLDLLTPGLSVGLLALCGVIAAANVCLALAWHTLLRHQLLNVSLRWSVLTYGVSQLAKYIPGNIAHLAGRQVLAVAAGLPGWQLARVMAVELGVQAIAATVFAVLIVPLVWPALPIWVALLGWMVALGVMGWGAGRFSRALTQALIWNWLFLLVSAGVFVAILLVLMPESLTFTLVVAAGSSFIVAWLIGFVTPGAPAGVGVREIILLTLLGSYLPEQGLILAVVLARLVTLGGDIVYFSAAGIAVLQQRLQQRKDASK
ncbi:hypothetical protein [Halovibrio sp. HP20-50]|uniref:hypothetical protein n=1 Tax=Halovibrio sp. HP20-59 TaxID=3080275 RepID=UPI00294AAAE6|nr:hypothetical protein [Halovibrio sp. HP20-59]MEA2120100.1 hypothetical protein [Halovibrio sp. HP20-59]